MLELEPMGYPDRRDSWSWAHYSAYDNCCLAISVGTGVYLTAQVEVHRGVAMMHWRSPVAGVRGWALWTVPAAGLYWMTAVIALAVALTSRGLSATVFDPGQAAAAAVLTGCAAVCVEAMRRVGEPAGVATDLLSAWTLPVALLLPPVYSLLVALPLMVLLQVRVRRGLTYRRAYSVAVIGLSNWVVSVAFHHYLQRADLELGTTAVQRTSIVLVALGCGALGLAINLVLIGIAVRTVSPEMSWRSLVIDREQRLGDAGEICLGVCIAGCWFVTPVLAVTMLVPVLLVQRSLTYGQLRAAARTDAKTGLLNAKAWQEEAEREIVRAHREGQPVAILIADLDHFKRINDAHGHLAGDVALLAAVSALSGGLRTYDQLGRFGGEEFTAVLPRTGHAEARRIAERLRLAVTAAAIVLDGTAVPLSVSVGVAILGRHGNDLTDLLAAADRALYCAKRAGRNQVVIAA